MRNNSRQDARPLPDPEEREPAEELQEPAEDQEDREPAPPPPPIARALLDQTLADADAADPQTRGSLEERVTRLEELVVQLDSGANERLEALEDGSGTLLELRRNLDATRSELERARVDVHNWLRDARALGWNGEEAFVDWVRSRLKPRRGRPPGAPASKPAASKRKRKPWKRKAGAR